MSGKVPLYRDLAVRISTLVDRGVYATGDRIPSIRELAGRFSVSINTVKGALSLLEARGYLECHPQSGYYVRESDRRPEPPSLPPVEYMDPRFESLCRIYSEVTSRIGEQAGPSLAITAPDDELLPAAELLSALRRASRVFHTDTISYALSPGLRLLREEIARRMAVAGAAVSPDEIVVTAGCTEAIFLSLMALQGKGEVIAVESPVYFNFRSLCERLGLRMIEIPSDPWKGVSVEVLEYVLDTVPVRAFLCTPVFNNPLGFVMPPARMRELVALCERKGVAIIEDDIYGEIAFSGRRPLCLKSFDQSGNVICCSSFSKSLAPGYRIGWACPGKRLAEVDGLKRLSSLGASTPAQVAIGTFLHEGGYERHLRRLCRSAAANMASAREAVLTCFPPGTRATEPEGGYALWIELPAGSDALTLYEIALREGILIAPGCIFSSSGRYNNCLRLNAGRWSPEILAVIRRVGELAGSCGAGEREASRAPLPVLIAEPGRPAEQWIAASSR